MSQTRPITRLKIFAIPHQGLRHGLSQFSFLAGNTDYRDAFAIGELHRLGHEIFTLLTVHASEEDQYTLAALEERCPGTAQHHLHEHEVIGTQQVRLQNWLDTLLARARAGADVTAEGEPFHRALGHFHSAYLQHMLEEEEAIQPLMWAHFSDAEILELRRRIIANMDPQVMLLWVKYSAPALSNADRVRWMQGLQAEAPAAFFREVMAALVKVLSPLQLEMLQFELILN